MVVISSGGELGRLAGSWGVPWVQLPTNIPYPRAGLGAMCIPPMIVLEEMGLFPGAQVWVDEAVEQLRKRRDQLTGEKSPARELARVIGRTIPLIYGGGQESGLRAGTEPVASIVALGTAAELAAEALSAGETKRLHSLRDRLHHRLAAHVAAEVVDEELAELAEVIGLRAGVVRRDDHVRQRPERMIGGQGLGLGHVQAGSRQVPRAQRRDERVRVDGRAPPEVDDEGSARQCRELALTEQPAGLWRERQQVHEQIGASEERRELSARVPLLMGIRDKLALSLREDE